MKWNERLRHERKSQGWTQRLLAEKIGTNTYTVNRWENGNAFPSPFYREQLSQIFGHDFEDFELFEATLERSKSTSEEASLPWKDRKVQHAPYYRKKVSTLVSKTTPELDLLWDTNENNAVQGTLPPVAQPTSPDILTEASFLIDPTIPQALDNVNSLLGRHDLLIQVRQRLLAADNLTFTVLHGLPGSGKTALAAAITMDREVQTHFYDGILWARLGPHPSVLGQLAHWGKLLGVTPSQVGDTKSREAWGRALQAAIGTRRFLLIIDNARRTEDALAFQLGGPQCTYLLTTSLPQIALAFSKQEAIMVTELEEADGLVLLAHFVPQLVQQDPEGARALVQAVGSLPLALTQMGKYLASHSLIGQPLPLRAVLVKLHQTERHLRTHMPSIPGQQSPGLTEIMPLSLQAAIVLCDQQLSQEHTTLVDFLFRPEGDSSHTTGDDPFFSHRSLWNIRISRIRSLPTFGLFNRFSWRSQLVLSIVLLAILIIIVDLLAFNNLSLLGSVLITKSPTAPSGTSYEAEASENTRAGGARLIRRSNCSGGKRVGYIGEGGILQFNDLEGESTGNYELTIYYVLSGNDMPMMYTTINSEPIKVFNLPNTGKSNIVRIFTITVQLNAGTNTMMFLNPSSYGPDIDRIVVRRT